MAPSFDYGFSSLLCAEDNNSIFDDICYDGTAVEESESEATWNHHRSHRTRNQNRSLPLQSDEGLSWILEKECHHLPNSDYLNRLQSGDFDVAARKEAIDWISKAHAHFGFGPVSAYLSINYLDRFLSAYELPKGKAWMMQLLAVACLSLAAKMEETEVPLSVDLQVWESKFLFEAKTIQRMELLVLSTLNWRMQAITPFSFIDYFIHKINGGDGVDVDDQTQVNNLVSRSIRLIISTKKGINFLEFKHSEIAAAVAISIAAGETKTVDDDTERAISLLSQHVKKERVTKCIKLLHDFSLIGGGGCSKGAGSGGWAPSPSVPQSPIGVLDAAASLSYKSDENTRRRVESCAAISSDTKRRKTLNNREHAL